jgi:hypothetical protein
MRTIDPDPHGVDHQGVTLVMADGIPVPGRRQLRWMLLVHAHVADFVILVEEHHGLVRQLEHPHCHVFEKERHRFRPAGVGRVRIGHAGEREFALFPHNLRRPGLQNRILVIGRLTPLDEVLPMETK